MKIRLSIIIFILWRSFLCAQPSPGDLYREYTWYNQVDDCGGALRVGGRLDYRLTENAVPYHGNGLIVPRFNVDLRHATRAELLVEKMLCHGGTTGLRVSINGMPAVYMAEPEKIPVPRADYAHHANLLAPLDLSSLREGDNNSFVFEVDTAGHWWPQNLIYGMILRIYYEDSVWKDRAVITSPLPGSTLGLDNSIRLSIQKHSEVDRVDLVGYYEDADLEGDGLYQQWHYAYHQCQIYNHIGSISHVPFEYRWNTEWLPDQHTTLEIAAMVHLKNGLTYMTRSVDGLTLERPGISVELCKPYRRPRGWFTRNGEFEERFQVKGDLDKAVDARMVFRSWSPGYFNGIYINDFIVFIKEGPKYAYFQHDIPLRNYLYVLEERKNILRTGMTPLYHGEMVHGAEIQWPGIMVLIKYDLDQEIKTSN